MSTKNVRQLRQRHAAIAWLARVAREHPLGFVTVPVAARVLGVTTERVRYLVAEGRLESFGDMPGGLSKDRFIPVTALIDAPFAMTRGRPGVYGPKNRAAKKKLNDLQKDHNPRNLSSLGR